MKIIDLRGKKSHPFFEKIQKRGEIEIHKYMNEVYEIIENVRNFKEKSLIEYTQKFDGFTLTEDNYFFDRKDFERAYNLIDKDLKEALEFASKRIEKYHLHQKEKTWFITDEEGIILGQKVSPLERVGVYVPGGKALYPSTLLMTVIPAKVAGVKEVYVASPCFDFDKSLPVLAACHISGVDKLFKIGGAHAIGAFAFGSKWIPKVDKIVGPGNIYVAMAKKILFGIVDIDMFAGPSEILIISDGKCSPYFVANDLLSQAEHDELSSAILITNDNDFALKVRSILEEEVERSERKSIISKSLENYSAIIVVESLDRAIEIANLISPEHLEIITEEPFKLLNSIKNAGAIFLGEYSPEPIGDYVAGSNHVLPTGGTAKFFSPLGVYDFCKKSSVIYISKKAYSEMSKHAKALAKCEGLIHHYNSLRVRDEG